MRRLLLLVSVVILVDTMLYAVLVPLLPKLAHQYGLGKGGAGGLVAAYAAGTLVGALPGGVLVARIGSRPAVLTGLTLMAVASLGFGFAGSAATLVLARLVQGFGSTLTWAGGLAWLVSATPRERRGEMLGAAMGAAVFGALLGPVVGAIAGVAGTRETFVALAVLGALVFAWAFATEGVPPDAQGLSALRGAFREPELLGGVWLIVLPAILFGVLAVLVPLQLGAYGWGTVGIGTLFLGAAGLEVALNPLLGRFSDRRGRLLPVRVALVASILVSLGLAWARQPALIAPLVFGAALAYGAFYTPGLALISHSADSLGLSQGLAFGLMNAGWGLGAVAGPAAGGALAGLAGDTLPYVLSAAICAATLAALTPRALAGRNLRETSRGV